MLPKFLAYIVILRFERRYPKQNSVIRLKANILLHPNFLLHPMLARYATAGEGPASPRSWRLKNFVQISKDVTPERHCFFKRRLEFKKSSYFSCNTVQAGQAASGLVLVLSREPTPNIVTKGMNPQKKEIAHITKIHICGKVTVYLKDLSLNRYTIRDDSFIYKDQLVSKVWQTNHWE